jgi:hypothetical protein
LHDFYTKLSSQEKMFLYITLGVIVAAVFDFLFLQPVFSKLKTLDVAIVQTKDDIRRDVRYLAYKEKIFKEQEVYRAYKLDEAKTEDQIFSAFLGAVENFAREVEVNPGKLNPGDVVRKKGYAQYFANMECSGKFENIIKLIHKIDTTPNLLKVVKMNIVGKKSSADEVTVIMKISKLIIDAKTVADNLELENSAKESSEASTGSTAANLGGSTGMSSENNNFKDGKSGRSGENGAGESAGGSGGAGGNGGGVDGAGESGGGSGGAGGNGGGVDGAGESGGGSGGAGGNGGGVDGAEESGGGSGGAGGNGGVGAGAGSGGVGGDSNAAPEQEGSDKNGGVVIGGRDGNNAGSGNVAKTAAKSRRAGSGSGGFGAGGDRGDEEKPKDKATTPTPLDKVTTGERKQVQSLESLWNNFWGIKPKVKEPKPLTQREKDELRRDQEQEDEVKPNLIERMLDSKK